MKAPFAFGYGVPKQFPGSDCFFYQCRKCEGGFTISATELQAAVEPTALVMIRGQLHSEEHLREEGWNRGRTAQA